MELLWREPRVVPPPADVPTLCRLFEDAARRHATHLGVGVEHLHRNGQAWVLGRFSLRIAAMPLASQSVEVTTWPSRRTSGIRAWRDFELRSSSGALLAEATSIWLILDLASRRPTRLPPRLLTLDFPACDTAIAPPPATPEPDRPPDSVSSHPITASDLDENNHANNVAYLAWACAAAPPSLAAAARIAELHADYRGESFQGEVARISAWQEPAGHGVYWLRQRLECGQRLLTRVTTLWRAAQSGK
jgi:acyl-ACP thioesterase